MMRSNAEVVIVGAGPAGAATALLLARAGRDVLLLDRCPFPRPKPCGDCLSIGATSLLDRLGVLHHVVAGPHASVRGWRIVAPNGNAFDALFSDLTPESVITGRDTAPECGQRASRSGGSPADDDSCSASQDGFCALAVERGVLDSVLLDAALAAGARFEQCAVTDVARDSRGRARGVRSRDGVRTAPITVGADGLRSIIARRLGASTRPGSLRKLSLTFHAPVERVSALGEMHVGDGICIGIAPVSGDRCNVTLVADSIRFGRYVAADPHAFARSALHTLPRVRGRVSDAALSAAPLASGPFDRPVRQVAYDGAVLAGDAAGYYDPFTGQGVYQALASAFLLAPCIDDALRRDDATASVFSSYVRARAALVRGPRLVQHGIEAVLSRPGRANRAIGRIRDATPFARAILAVTGDIRPARALLSPRALASLIFRSRPEIAA